MEAKANYTLMFHGRAAMPWRFRDNRPVAVVLACRTAREPMTFEIAGARMAEVSR